MIGALPSILASTKPCYLLKAPVEVQTIICNFACKYDEPIKPQQWLPRSRFFVHDLPYSCGSKFHYRIQTAPVGHLPVALTAFSLAKTCRNLYNLVDGENVFYKVNEFEFVDTITAMAYLASISDHRRAAIQNIKIVYADSRLQLRLMPLLNICSGLRYLTLDVSSIRCEMEEAGSLDKFDSLLLSIVYTGLLTLRGLETFNLVCEGKENDSRLTELESQVSLVITQPQIGLVGAFIERKTAVLRLFGIGVSAEKQQLVYAYRPVCNSLLGSMTLPKNSSTFCVDTFPQPRPLINGGPWGGRVWIQRSFELWGLPLELKFTCRQIPSLASVRGLLLTIRILIAMMLYVFTRVVRILRSYLTI